ncbi:hypothetical protein, partial [Aeromonas sp. QDB18]
FSGANELQAAILAVFKRFSGLDTAGIAVKTERNRLFGRIAHRMRNMSHQNQNMMAAKSKLFTQICVKHCERCGQGDAVRPDVRQRHR